MVTKDPNKIDLRLDPGLREVVETVALERFGAKIHHISKKPEITTALNHLIRLGIQALENTEGQPVGTIPPMAVNVTAQLQALENSLRADMEAAIAGLREEIEALKKLDLPA